MRNTSAKLTCIMTCCLFFLSIIIPGINLLAKDAELLTADGIANNKTSISILSDGDYLLEDGYSGIITIANSVKVVKIAGSNSGNVHLNTWIEVLPRTLPLDLTLENLKIAAPAGKHGIDFANAPDVNYTEWPYQLNSKPDNTMKPLLYYMKKLQQSFTARLYISGSSSISGGKERTGIHVGDGVHLVIDKAPDISDDSQALLKINGDKQSAGIGGGWGFNSGAVTINGGTITTMGGADGPGLGDLGGAIIINGGSITASGGKNGPGIGIGNTLWQRTQDYFGKTSANLNNILPGSSITINGGAVTSIGGDNAPGMAEMNGAVTINGGYVRAVGKNGDAGIGSKWTALNGGTVIALGGPQGGAGIGGGVNCAGGVITIGGTPDIIAVGGSPMRRISVPEQVETLP